MIFGLVPLRLSATGKNWNSIYIIFLHDKEAS